MGRRVPISWWRGVGRGVPCRRPSPVGVEGVGAAGGAVLGGEELFHAAGGGVGDKDAAGGEADEGEAVRDAAGAEDGIHGAERVESGADLDAVLAFEDVEPLVFDGVAMEGRAALGGVVVLHGEEVVAAVFGGDLEGGGAVGQRPLSGVTVFVAMERRRGCGRVVGGAEAAGECEGGKKGGGGAEKGASREREHGGLPLRWLVRGPGLRRLV